MNHILRHSETLLMLIELRFGSWQSDFLDWRRQQSCRFAAAPSSQIKQHNRITGGPVQ
jgi:hypothetical protein